ncbi:hypothetical protein VMCG_01355 [Cytospora schulzeri]|uniref:RING-type E3 ubiquitin transferase n=1 Tax=Cytospora schulzeri TaxID=448051 RepID=A0A423X747_9PEZI|nr:hypothetical protein VMCG_01355 [Valsa malicola]
MASSSVTSSPFPYAAAPDIIRAHQKDVYFQGLLTSQLVDLHRRLLGARSAHAWANESRTAADLLYLCLTTLLGNRTLGEEYCDLIQVEEEPSGPSPKTAVSAASSNDKVAEKKSSRGSATVTVPATAAERESGGPRLPSLGRRSAYIALSILAPYLFSRLLPTIRSRLRQRLESRLAALQRQGKTAQNSLEYRARRYLLTHLTSVTSGAHVHAVVLATFYFSGAFYSLSKRLTRLRYVFTRRLPEQPGGGGLDGKEGRAGYEVLGVLLVIQLAVQGYLHVRSTLQGSGAEEVAVEAAIRERAFGPGNRHPSADVSLDHEHSYGSGNNDLLLQTSATSSTTTSESSSSPGGTGGQRSKAAIGAMAHTPVPRGDGPRYDLRDGGVMGWVKGRAQRNCTLCLEELKDPSATPCGHVFCWACIGDWVREKPECPLCRREAMVQHILPLRMAAAAC